MNARVRQDAEPVAPGGEPAGELDSLLRAAPARKAAADSTAVCLGRIVSVDERGSIEVEFPGSGGPRTARLLMPAAEGTAVPALQTGQQVLLAFENGDPSLPIVLGFLHAQSVPDSSQPGEIAESSAVAASIIEADVDGKRLRIVAQDEIVLQCGSASITLRRNGRVVIRGTYVETCSDGTNRIKGGQVRIN